MKLELVCNFLGGDTVDSLFIKPVFRIHKIFIQILGPVSIITDPVPDLDPTCSPAIVNEHYWSMHHISKLKVPIQKFSLPS